LKIPGCSAGVGGTSMHCEGSTTLPASHGLPCPPLQQREFPSSEVCLLFTWEKLSLTGRKGSVLPVCAAHWVFHMRSFFPGPSQEISVHVLCKGLLLLYGLGLKFYGLSFDLLLKVTAAACVEQIYLTS
jgi:hypothetical protein